MLTWRLSVQKIEHQHFLVCISVDFLFKQNVFIFSLFSRLQFIQSNANLSINGRCLFVRRQTNETCFSSFLIEKPLSICLLNSIMMSLKTKISSIYLFHARWESFSLFLFLFVSLSFWFTYSSKRNSSRIESVFCHGAPTSIEKPISTRQDRGESWINKKSILFFHRYLFETMLSGILFFSPCLYRLMASAANGWTANWMKHKK